MSDYRILLEEVRGCMTHFDPLTPEIVERESKGQLSYNELARILSDFGMDIRHVVYDGTRHFQKSYYADFEKGHYCWVPLQDSSVKELLKPYAKQFSESLSLSNMLRNHDWASFYLNAVPLPMLVYDFERRYLDIEPEQVFQVWTELHTRIDYAKNMWSQELLQYVFAHAPMPASLPNADPDGRITIYRGMGEKSQAPEKAISWTTSPVCALWFANRSGRGTRLVSARVLPEQILAYMVGHEGEQEVILRPDAVVEIQDLDMIPCTEQYVPQLLIPVTREFLFFGELALKLGYPAEKLFQAHGVKHILRVLTLTLLYCCHSGDPLSGEDKQILIYFSLLHDIGRDSEWEDETHGDKAVEQIQNRNVRIKGIQLSKKGHRIAELLIRHHCRDDETGMRHISKASGFSAKDIRRTAHLYNIAKDMDGLDRVRLNDLDFRMLRTEYAKKLPLVAGGLLEEPLLQCLEGQANSCA